jgi:RNA-directed DNA polymerase
MPELIDVYVGYLSPLLKNQVPIIFDFRHLCLLLERTPDYLASVINSSESHYRDFNIPKKSGGQRLIRAPYPALMECQNWIYQNILVKIKIHSAAQGFAFKKSIITNASIHINQIHFLKIDLKDFFPTIKINQVISVFKTLGYSHKVSFYLAAICCCDGELPQGAPTSPFLSNIIAKPLDHRLLSFSKRFDLKYTRYADDLAFSGDEIPVKYIEYITNIIIDAGFIVNQNKTVLQQNPGKRILTGISIADEKIQVPREYKRKLKQEVHYIRTFGLTSHIRKKKIKNPNYLFSIIGKLRFWLSVEKDNKYAKDSLDFFVNLLH